MKEVLLRSEPAKASSERRIVEPEVVATSPCRIKSPVPVCCGFGSLKLACQAAARDSIKQCPPSCVRRGSLADPATRAKAGGRERTCTSKAHRLLLCGVCFSHLTTRPKAGSPHSELPSTIAETMMVFTALP